MPEKDFIIWLDGQTYIKVDFVTGGDMKNTLQNSAAIRSRRIPRTPWILKSMREDEVVRWLKSQGAIPTPPEMRGRLQKAGHHGLPSEEDRHSEKLKS